ncbi:MAG: DUF4198 domain-containing protein [Pirellula sp.]|nr:DUF4198 domain-containing protein [Pirellula sp.]
MKRKILLAAALILSCVNATNAHDTWVQTPSLVTRQGEFVYVDLMLGNHGNDHRDFKLASKITLAPCELELIAPDGTKTDLKSQILDMGSAEKEGFWTTRYVAEQKGLYQVLHKLDILHGKTRAVKSSKTYFFATDNYQSISTVGAEKIVPLNEGLEFVIDTPIETLGAGQEIRLRLLWNGKPLPSTRVSFIPRGAVLAEGFDPQYERNSDANGFVSYTPAQGNFVLAVAHHVAADEKGEGYDKTHYGATVVLPVPQSVYVK